MLKDVLGRIRDVAVDADGLVGAHRVDVEQRATNGVLAVLGNLRDPRVAGRGKRVDESAAIESLPD